MTETLANESAPRELSNEYQHDRAWMIFKNLCICVLWTKVDLALEGLSASMLLNTPTKLYKACSDCLQNSSDGCSQNSSSK